MTIFNKILLFLGLKTQGDLEHENKHETRYKSIPNLDKPKFKKPDKYKNINTSYYK